MCLAILLILRQLTSQGGYPYDSEPLATCQLNFATLMKYLMASLIGQYWFNVFFFSKGIIIEELQKLIHTIHFLHAMTCLMLMYHTSRHVSFSNLSIGSQFAFSILILHIGRNMHNILSCEDLIVVWCGLRIKPHWSCH